MSGRAFCYKVPIASARRLTWLAFATVLLAPTLAAGQAGDVGGFTRLGSFPTFEPYEHFDAQNVRILLTFTDLVLPGHRGRDLRIQRTFIEGTSTTPAQWRWGIAGVPMSISEMPYTPYQDSDAYLLTRGPKMTMADGGTRQLYFETFPNPTPTVDPAIGRDPSYRYFLSTDRWRYDAVERRLYFPDGMVCDYSAGYLTDCWDVYGPILKQGLTQVLEGTLEAPTQERVVWFTTSSSGGSFTTQMHYLDRTWTMTQTGNQWTFVGPEGTATWTFEAETKTATYSPNAQTTLLKRVTTPAGGTIEYTYQEPTIPPYTDPEFGFEIPGVSLGWFLATRTASGTDVPTGQWGFGYEFYDGYDSPWFVSITAPATGGSARTTKYWNVRGAGYAEGQPGITLGPTRVTRTQEITIDESPSRIIENIFKWARLVTYIKPSGAELPLSVFVPGLTVTTVCLPGGCATASEDRQDYDGFMNATRVVESSSALPGIERVTETAYLNQVADGQPYLLGLPTTSTISQGTNTVSSQVFYTDTTHPLASGFVFKTVVGGVTTEFEPDAHGNIWKTRVAPGTSSLRETVVGYDWGVMKTITTAPATANAVTTSRNINPDGTVAAETQGYGTPNARTTAYTYDALGRIKSETPPGDGQITLTEYDNSSNRWVRTTRGGARMETTLDAFGRPVLTRTGTTTAYLTQISTSYYADGRLQFSGLPAAADSSGNPGTTYVYDDAQALTTEINADGTRSSRIGVVADGGGQRVKTTMVDEKGHTSVQVHAGFGDLVGTSIVAVIDPADQTWRYTYDSLSGALTQVSGPDNVTRNWVYQAGTKRLQSETHPESGQVQYLDYWPDGSVKRTQDARGTTVDYDYDDAGRPSHITETLAGGAPEITTYSYWEGSGQLKTVTSPTVTSTYGYDDAGRIHSRTDTVDGKPFTVTYDYDSSDNLAKVTYPSDRVVRYGYDAANRLIAACRDVSPCNDTTALVNTYAKDFHYRPSGALEDFRSGNGLVTSMLYDETRQRLINLQVGTGATHVLDFTYSYDPVGNITGIADALRGQWTQTFCYDALDRLTLASAAAYGTLGYEYDAHGNRQTGGNNTNALNESQPCATAVHGAAAFTYDPTNRFRLTQIAGGPSLAYDSNGNLTTAPGVTYSYNPQNQIKTTTQSGGATTQYAYDDTQWRVKKAVSGQAVVYTIRGPNGELLSEWTNTSPMATVRDYIYAGGRLIGVASTHQQPK